MIVRVCERAAACAAVSRVIVATDDRRILDAVTAAGFEAVMTREDHASGTDRVAEVAERLDAELVVNVQGDEPLLPHSTIDAAIRALRDDPAAAMSTTCEPIASAEEFLDPNVVKVVVDASGRALYFSRAPIPFPRDAAAGAGPAGLAGSALDLAASRKHTGLYVYRRDFLLEFARTPPSALELRERLEQLRALEHGHRIRVVDVPERSIGVDTPADLERVRSLWVEPA